MNIQQYYYDNFIDAKNEFIGGGDINSGNVGIGGTTASLSEFLYISSNSNLYLANSNINGEIKFQTLYEYPNNNDVGVKIDSLGKLQVYHNYNIAYPLITQGYFNVEDDLAGLKQSSLVSSAEMLVVQGQISGIQSTLTTHTFQITEVEAVQAVHTAILQEDLENYTFFEEFMNFGTDLNIETARQTAQFRLERNKEILNNLMTGVGLTAIGGAIAGIYNSIEMKAQSNLYSNVSNGHITQSARDETTSNFAYYNRRSIIDFNSNLSNAELENGFINSNVINQQFIPSLNINQIKISDTNISNIFVASNVLSNINLNEGFINSNLINQQFIPELKSNKLMLGTISTPNLAYQMEMTGDLNLNELYRNSTSLTSLLNQKQDNMSATQPIYITTGNIGLNYDSSLTKIGNNLSVLKTATTPIVISGNDFSLNYDSSLTKISGSLSVVKTASLPLSISASHNFSLNYDSTLTLSGNNLKVADAVASKWTQSGNIIYNNNTGNIGIGITNPEYKLDVNGNIYGRNNLYIGNSSIISSYTNASINSISGTNDKYLTYTTNGTLVLNDLLNCEIFMIGGGGGGGYNHGGGGGAGAYYRGNITLNAGSYSITIGNGGLGSTNGNNQQNGGDTFIQQSGIDIQIGGLNVRCKGGGCAGTISGIDGSAGGCGGGGDGWSGNTGTNRISNGGATNNSGTFGSGSRGGNGRQFYNQQALAGGGGGGIGTNGYYDVSGKEGSDGGDAMIINITGTSNAYGGGGGGGEWPSYTGDPAGLGGGANINGSYVRVGGNATRTEGGSGGDAIANTGSGGGGGKAGRGGNGSDGIVIIRFTETGKIGIGTSIPNNKLHIEKGSVFIGDNSIGNGSQIDNGYRLVFDSSYTATGANKCNKILLHKNDNAPTYIAGFGVEAQGLTYSVWTGAYHNFYTSATTTSGGFLSCSIYRDNFRFYGSTNAGAGGVISNGNNGTSAYSYLSLANDTGNGILFLNSSTKTTDGGANCLTLRNDVSGGDLRLSANLDTPYIYLKKSTGLIGIDTTAPAYKLTVNGSLGCGAINSTSITTNNNAINAGTGGLTCGAISSGTITTNNNSINAGTATISANTFSGKINPTVNTWNTSTDGYNRFYFGNNSRSYYGSGDGHEWRNNNDSRIMSLDNTGALLVRGEIGFINRLVNVDTPGDHIKLWHNGDNAYMDVGGAGGFVIRMNNSATTYPATSYTSVLTISDSGNVSVLNAFGCGQLTCTMTSVANSGNDYVCVQINTTQGANYYATLKIAYGSFTSFHRFFCDDELFDKTNEDTMNEFKNNYIGRVVISTGKIKTHTTQGAENDEWFILEDKDGITIEDAHCIVRLSNKKKDKKVIGVIGLNRNNSAPDRIIVNSAGEGGIWVLNTNGNIENGDLLQTSDYLGYAEKADDDIIRNYTIGKSMMDCNFQLNSPYYKSIDLGNGVIACFIACVYYCG